MKHSLKIILMVLWSLSVSCSSSRSKSGDYVDEKARERKGYALEKGKKAPEFTITPLEGLDSDLASLDGDQVLYSSQKRNAHDHAQIYRYNVKDKKESRVTFSDGNSYRPVWAGKNQTLYYFSDTDESKERSDFIIKNIDPVKGGEEVSELRGEIYSSDLLGKRIKRLTREAGFDGDQDIHEAKNLMAFVSKRDGGKDLFLLFLGNGHVQRITGTKEDESSPRFSSDGKKLAWLETAGEKQSLIVGWPGKKRDVLLTLKNETIGGLSWHPQSDLLLFHSKLANGVSQIFEINSTNKCLRRLTYAPQAMEEPVIVGSELFFLAQRKGSSALGHMTYSSGDNCVDIALDPTIIKE